MDPRLLLLLPLLLLPTHSAAFRPTPEAASTTPDAPHAKALEAIVTVRTTEVTGAPEKPKGAMWKTVTLTMDGATKDQLFAAGPPSADSTTPDVSLLSAMPKTVTLTMDGATKDELFAAGPPSADSTTPDVSLLSAMSKKVILKSKEEEEEQQTEPEQIMRTPGELLRHPTAFHDKLVLTTGGVPSDDFFSATPPPTPDFAPTTSWWSLGLAAGIVAALGLAGAAGWLLWKHLKAPAK